MTEGGWDAQSMEDSGLFTHCQSFRALGRILRGLEIGRAPSMFSLHCQDIPDSMPSACVCVNSFNPPNNSMI